ncbi:MAG: hypothetical protein KTR31_17400 [Myxococcales bacterium]|nr:hypothetical protein [Myxococcales bacterium]
MTGLRVGVTGHRKLGADPRVARKVHAQCVHILSTWQALSPYAGPVQAVSALAIGADQLFAEAALGLQIPLVGVIPFDDYPEDFEGPDRARFEELVDLCDRVERLPRKRRTNRAYLAAGHWVVDHVDHLVAVWNGAPAAGVGGTGDVVAYAQKRRCPVLRIDPAP